MHSPFRHTALPQTTMAAQGHDLTDDWSLPSAHFVDSGCPFRCSSGCVFIEPDVLKTVYRSTIPLRYIWSICSGN